MLDRVMTYTHREQFSFLIRLESGECLGLEIDPCRLYRWLSSCPGRLVNVQEIDNVSTYNKLDCSVNLLLSHSVTVLHR